MKKIPGRYLRPAFQLLGIAIFAVIVSRIDFDMVLGHYRRIDPRMAVPAAAVVIIFILTKSYRWKAIVGMQGIRISLKDAALVYTASLYLGIITPGRVGDFAKSIYLANSGASAGKALYSSMASTSKEPASRMWRCPVTWLIDSPMR